MYEVLEQIYIFVKYYAKREKKSKNVIPNASEKLNFIHEEENDKQMT